MEVPVIDLASFGTNEVEAAKAIRAACEKVGFFYLTSHGVAQTLVDAAFEQSRLYFALPLEEKMKMLASAATKNRGYTPMAEETLDVSNQKVGDQKEGLYFGREVSSTFLLPVLNFFPTNSKAVSFFLGII